MLTENELIAEFMGWHKDSWGEWVSSFNGAHFDKGELRYDKMWDWLMPVVEKIEKHCHVTIRDHMCEIANADNAFLGREGGKLKSTHKAIVEFIKWHNAQEK